jgi:hypothetical protein
MIVRVLGVGQWHLDDSDVAVVERADDAVEAAIAAGDEAAFSEALRNLIETIAEVGTPVADDDFLASDVIVPDADTTLAEAAALEEEPGEGLIPG